MCYNCVSLFFSSLPTEQRHNITIQLPDIQRIKRALKTNCTPRWIISPLNSSRTLRHRQIAAPITTTIRLITTTIRTTSEPSVSTTNWYESSRRAPCPHRLTRRHHETTKMTISTALAERAETYNEMAQAPRVVVLHRWERATTARSHRACRTRRTICKF